MEKYRDRSTARQAESLEASGETLSAFIASLFGAYVAIMLGNSNPWIVSEDGSSIEKVIAIFLANVVALVAIGLIGPKAGERQLFFFGLLGALGSLAVQIVAALFPYHWIDTCRVFLNCATSATLTLAWYERLAGVTLGRRVRFLSLYSLFAVCFVLISTQLPESWIPYYSVALLMGSATASYFLLRRPPSTHADESPHAFPRYASATIFVFGFMIGLFALLNISTAQSTSYHARNLLDAFSICWTLFAFLVTAVVRVLVSRKNFSLSTAVLIPLLTLGLLFPLAIHDNNSSQAALSTIITFLVICQMNICSIGPSNARKTFTFKGRTFVVWERSFSLVGMISGFAIGVFVVNEIDVSYNIVLISFVVYGILTLTIATLLGLMSVRALLSGDAPSQGQPVAIDRLSRQFGLTPRETEILSLVAQGRSIPYVQKELHIAPGTAATHINHIHQKLGVHDRQELLDLIQQEAAEAGM